MKKGRRNLTSRKIKPGKPVTGQGTNKTEAVVADFRAMFEAGSSPCLVLLPDKKFTIAAVNDSYNKATMTARKDIVGRGVFDVFPDNPDDPNADGVAKLSASLNRVIKNKKPDAMAIQKYDIAGPGGSFQVRYWEPYNAPVLDKNNKIKYILHRVMDVTEMVELKKKRDEQEEWVKKIRAAEQKHIKSIRELETLFRHLTDNLEGHTIFLVDEEGCVTSWNEGAEKITGYKENEANGRSIALLYTDEEVTLGKHKSDMSAAVKNGRYKRRRTVTGKHNQTFTADCMLTPSYNDAGLLTGFTCLINKVATVKENGKSKR